MNFSERRSPGRVGLKSCMVRNCIREDTIFQSHCLKALREECRATAFTADIVRDKNAMADDQLP